jgi:hypothetical protein
MSCATVSFTGGGLKFWIEASSTTTQDTVSFTPKVSATNVNAAIRPKGTGALLSDVPDGTATGGNARGAYAVDLQHARTTAAQVAGAAYATIVGGKDNTNNSQYGVVGGFNNNAPSGFYATIFGLNNTVASFIDAPSIVGGRNNTANANYGFIGSGDFNTITAGVSSAIVGGSSNTINVAATGLAFIGGGTLNSITGASSVIGGGRSNTVAGTDSVIVGGNSNATGSSLQSFIGGGFSNSISNNYSVICGGYDNTSVGTAAFVGGGQSNNHTAGTYAVLVGGDSNYVNGDWATLTGGYLNQINATSASIVGGRQANAYLYAMQAYSAGQFSALADAQMGTIQMRRAITGTAIADLFLDGFSVQAILPATNTLWMVRIQLVAICTATGNGTTVVGASYVTERHAGIKRLNTTTSLVGSVQTIGTAQADATMSTSVVTITADDTNEALRVQFTPPSTAGTTTTFRVVATVELTQVKY